MSSDLDTFMASLHADDVPSPARPPQRPVQHLDGTTGPAPFGRYDADRPTLDSDIDPLFQNYPSYRVYKKEKPEHRLVLWMKLRGMSNEQVRLTMKKSRSFVDTVTKQPWFMEAFCRLSSEIGKDAVSTMLEGEVIASVQTLVQLRDNAESEAIRRQSAVDILDRIRGKPTQHVETKVSGGLDVAVFDAQRLMDEERRLSQELRSRGVGGTN